MDKKPGIIMLFLITLFSFHGLVFSAETAGNTALTQGKTLLEQVRRLPWDERQG